MSTHDISNRRGREVGPGGSSARQATRTDGLDVHQVVSSLRHGRGLISQISLLVFVLVMGISLASRMTFKARGSLYLGELSGKTAASNDAKQIDLEGDSQGDLTSEFQILQSRALLGQAILRSGTNVLIKPQGFHPPRYLQWLLNRRDPKLLDVAVPELGAVDTTLRDNYRGPQSFLVKFESTNHYALWSDDRWFGIWGDAPKLLGKGTLGEPTTLGGLDLTLMPGTARGPRVGATYLLRVTPLDDQIVEVLKALDITFPKPLTPGEASRVLVLEFSDKSPHQATSFLQQLMRDYLETRQSWKTEDATAAEAFVTNQLQVIRGSLDKTEKKLADYRASSRVVVLDDSARAMIEQIGKYEEQRIAARLEVASLSDMKRALKDPNAHVEAFLMGEGTDTVLQNFADNLSKSQTDLTSLQQRFNAAAPDVRNQQAQVDSQLNMVRNYVTSRLQRAQDNLGALGQVVSQYEEKLKTVPAAELGLAQLERESEVYSKIYSYLLERQQQTAIIKASRVSKNRILDLPQVPYREDSPAALTRLAASFLGVFLGIAFVLVRRGLSPTLNSESEVRTLVGSLPIFANIPRNVLGKRQALTTFDVLVGDGTSGFAEAFRMLRTNLYYTAKPSEGGRIVLVTSPAPSDGKTTVTFALASMLAADGRKVLIVDADLRKPSHHALLGSAQEPGIAALLTGSHTLSTTVRPTSEPNVYSLTAETLPSVDVLSSDRVAQMLRGARSHFDFILLDGPSYPLVSDPVILCEHADCVLSVLRLHHTPRASATRHLDSIAPLATEYGVVINDAESVLSATVGRARRPPTVTRLAAVGSSSKPKKVAAGKLVSIVFMLSLVALGATAAAMRLRAAGVADSAGRALSATQTRQHAVAGVAPLALSALPDSTSVLGTPSAVVPDAKPEPASATPRASQTTLALASKRAVHAAPAARTLHPHAVSPKLQLSAATRQPEPPPVLIVRPVQLTTPPQTNVQASLAKVPHVAHW